MDFGSQYEVIDTDPKFSKVMRYVRPSDGISWIFYTGLLPGAYVLYERVEPMHLNKFARPAPYFLRVATSFGFILGFFSAYKKSSKRLMGYSENAREVKKDRYESKKALSQHQYPWGTTELSPWLQQVAHKNSVNAQTHIHAVPWFNFTNHPYHGIDLRKYYEVREGEEGWGFELPPLEEIKARNGY